jgi:hypothetical protein
VVERLPPLTHINTGGVYMIIDVCFIFLTASVIYTLFFLTNYLKAKTIESQAVAESYKVATVVKKEEHNSYSILEQIQDVDSDVVVKAIRDPGLSAQFAWLEQEGDMEDGIFS